MPGREDLAVLDERIRPVASEPITGCNRPFRATDDAVTVEVEERCSDVCERHGLPRARRSTRSRPRPFALAQGTKLETARSNVAAC